MLNKRNPLPPLPPDLKKFLSTKLRDLTEFQYRTGMKRLKAFFREAARATR